jgi:PAS domain-containing protein
MPFGYIIKPFRGRELQTNIEIALYNHEQERRLRESEERFRRLAENARDMVYRMSLPDGRYEYVSPASSDLFGYSPDEFYSSPMLIREVIHPDWRDCFAEEWGKLLAGDVPPVLRVPDRPQVWRGEVASPAERPGSRWEWTPRSY